MCDLISEWGFTFSIILFCLIIAVFFGWRKYHQLEKELKTFHMILLEQGQKETENLIKELKRISEERERIMAKMLEIIKERKEND